MKRDYFTFNFINSTGTALKRYLLTVVIMLSVAFAYSQETITITTTSNDPSWLINFQNSGGLALEWQAIGPGINISDTGNNPSFDFSANVGNGDIVITITSNDDFDFEKWIVEDVPKVVIDNIASVSEKSDLYISGLSMGGFGALRLGIKYSDRFKAVSAHSSITKMEQMSLFVEESLKEYEQINKQEESVLELALDRKEHLPQLRFDCGTEDLLINHNRLLHEQLNKAQIAHEYEEFVGGHEWDYWQKHIKDSLRFFNKFIK